MAKRSLGVIDSESYRTAKEGWNVEAYAKVNTITEDEDRMVEGIVSNRECVGGDIQFVFRSRKGPIRRYKFKDGDRVTIPLSVAKHLNNGTAYPVHSQVLDADGSPTKQIGKLINRYEFRSTEYM